MSKKQMLAILPSVLLIHIPLLWSSLLGHPLLIAIFSSPVSRALPSFYLLGGPSQISNQNSRACLRILISRAPCRVLALRVLGVI